jgi:hypothetical protein
MKIHNVRAGFATNSSSSHSVILVGDEIVPSEVDGGDIYGWENFTLVTQEQKLRYLCAQAFRGVYDSEFDDFVKLVSETSGIEIKFDDEENIGVDHQSSWKLPPEHNSMRALVRHIMNHELVILGGNDNSDSHPLSEVFPHDPICGVLNSYSSKSKVRVDGEYIVAFDSGTGNKARVSLNRHAPAYVKSTSPELVDLKITDWCDLGCKFCYQASTTSGKHADVSTIYKIIDTLREMNVFEVAIGGGEPTSHPEFPRILTCLGHSNIVANFTTRTTRWLNDKEIYDAVKNNVGAIGVSCMSAKDLQMVKEIRDSIKPWDDNFAIAQHVLGSVPLDVTGEFLNQAFANQQHVLLLGYKTVGFGSSYERHDKGEVAVFLKMLIEKHENPRMSVDTALVDQYPDLIKALGVPDVLVTSPEGKFSCYVDAVTQKMGPSSYVEPSEMIPVPSTTEDFLYEYGKY